MNEAPTFSSSSPPPGSLRGVQEKLQELRAIQRGSRTVVLLMTLLILGATLTFVFMLWKGMEKEFSEPKLTAEGERILGVLAESEGDKVMAVISDVAPTYKDAAIKSFEEIKDPLAKTASEELAEFPKALEFAIDSSLRTSLATLMEKLKPSLEKSFPAEMKQGDGVQKLSSMIETKLAEQNPAIESHLHGLFEKERARIHEALMALGGADDGAQLVDLERHWLHLMLQYADYELMKDSAASGGQSAVPATGASTLLTAERGE